VRDFAKELRYIANDAGLHPGNRELYESAAHEIERLRALLLDACGVFDHYDLPEHALHYRRKIGPPSAGLA
jgi:hypothetical protein